MDFSRSIRFVLQKHACFPSEIEIDSISFAIKMKQVHKKVMMNSAAHLESQTSLKVPRFTWSESSCHQISSIISRLDRS